MGTDDRTSTGVSGAAILGDGTVGLILDPAALARLALQDKPLGAQYEQRSLAR